MTGAGSGELLFAKANSFLGALEDANDDTYTDTYAFGRNPSITELDLRRQLQRLREPNAAESVESIAQNVEGAVAVDAVISSDTFGEVENLVFNDGGTGFTTGAPQSCSIFTEIDYLSGTATRELKGCVPVDFSISYTQNGMVTFSISFIYADEEKDVTVPTNDVTRISDDTSAPFHGFDLSIDATSITKLQSATLNISEISRFHYGTDPTAVDAIIATPTTTFDAEAIFTGTSIQELAYGNTGDTTLQDTLTSKAATITIDDEAGTNISTYNFSSVKPDSYSWNDVVSDDSDTTNSYTFHVNDGVSVA